MCPDVMSALNVIGMVELGLLTVGSLMSSLDMPSVAFPDTGLPVPPGVAEGIAREFLDRVDWSSPTIVIWMPGINSSPGVRREFLDALRGVRGRYWVGALEFPRHADMRRNRPIGVRALELVLEEIRRRDPSGTRYRVSIGADSLGAWVANETIRRPVGDVVDAMTTFGVSAPATPLPAERAAKVRAYRNSLDPTTQPYIGWAELWTNAGDMVFGGGPSHLPATILHALLNPFITLMGLVTTVEYKLRGGERGTGFREHPHNYWREMYAAARYLVDAA